MKFGDNLKNIRKQRRISQEDLAEKLGVSRQSISKWETGENYPSMQNIMCLCTIFKCKVNDLVHESFNDIDFMDKEIKMSVVKLNEKEQKRMKGLTNVLSLIGKIGKILTRVGMGFLVVAMIIVPLFISTVEVKGDKLVVSGEVINITELDDGIRLTVSNNEHVVIGDLNKKDTETIINSIKKYKKPLFITLIELGFGILCVFLYIVSLALNRMEKLFTNIHDGSTPFTLENVEHMKKMSIYMIVAIILSAFGSSMITIAFGDSANIEFNLFNIVEIIFIYAMSYVFEYGYHIQKDSKGIMYND